MKLTTVIADAFGITGTQPEKTLEWAAQFIAQHPAARSDIGEIGEEAIGGHYRKVTGQAVIDGATVPFCVEAWVTAETVEKDEDTVTVAHPLLNRSLCLARLYGHIVAHPHRITSACRCAGHSTGGRGKRARLPAALGQ